VNYHYHFICFIIENTRPLLKDLYEHFTPNYATHWKVIGTLLGLSTETLNIIEHDNFYKAVPCCNAMLEKWLDVYPSASWNNLLTTIQSPAVSSAQSLEKGDPCLFNAWSVVNTDGCITRLVVCMWFKCGYLINGHVSMYIHWKFYTFLIQ